MPDLKPSRSVPTTTTAPIGINFHRTHTNTSNPPHPSPVFSTQHLDDMSVYNGGDHDSQCHEAEDAEDSDTLEKMNKDDEDDARRHGQDAVPEVRMGVRDTRDLEANNLEKQESQKSIRDPNLVRAYDVSQEFEGSC